MTAQESGRKAALVRWGKLKVPWSSKAERQKWLWHNDPKWRRDKMRSQRGTKIRAQIRRHEREIKRLEAELLRLNRTP